MVPGRGAKLHREGARGGPFGSSSRRDNQWLRLICLLCENRRDLRFGPRLGLSREVSVEQGAGVSFFVSFPPDALEVELRNFALVRLQLSYTLSRSFGPGFHVP